MSEILECRDVLFRVPEKGTLRVTGCVRSGDRVVIQGPSGCGKTTFLRVLAGFHETLEGQVLLGGEDLAAVDPSLRRVGWVFQSGGLFPHLSVLGNVVFGLKFQPHSKDWSPKLQQEKALDFLRACDLEELRDRGPERLSGGEKQRVLLARTLVTEPRYLLLDEPLSSLDRARKKSLLEWMLRLLEKSPIPTLMVTHDEEEAHAFGTRRARGVDAQTGVWEL